MDAMDRVNASTSPNDTAAAASRLFLLGAQRPPNRGNGHAAEERPLGAQVVRSI
jgi:hypothetical protein